MDMWWKISLCLGTALAWSAADVFRKKVAGRIPTEQFSFWIALLQLPLFFLWALFSLDEQSLDFTADYWILVVGCGLINAFTVLGMLLALRTAPLSVTIPLLSLTPLISAVIDWAWMGEGLNHLQFGGLCVATLGAIALGIGEQGWFKMLGAWVMIGVALIFSLLCALDAIALRTIPLGIHAFLELFFSVIFLAGFLFFRGQNEHFQRPPFLPTIFLAALSMTIALGIQLYAYQVGTAIAIVEAIKRPIGIVSSLLFGKMLFEESMSIRKLGSAIVLTFGILALLLG